ncbi:MAG: paraquat-inducible protein A [Desulfobacterales bacterium]|nr:MAG: paraquat-inducible protein A [Desulfobacterales bacterium]UCD89278.1 MAG: paraquat-inducible protein A [Desulfobacterales bacterium]
MNNLSLTAAKAALMNCPRCDLLSKYKHSQPIKHAVCPRCGAAVHLRKPNSINRTWALIIAAAIFYIPANIFPITFVTSLGKVQSDTIISGVIYFINTGMWPIALVIFTASIVVPLLKLLVLSFLLVSIQRKSSWRPGDRTHLFRITEAVGRWSMVDIYALTIVVALLKLGFFATVEAGPAAVYFAAVVVITMLAAKVFDPRLTWDAMESENE